jgi:putative membrane protein
MQLRYIMIGAVLILAGSITTLSAKTDPTFLTEAIQINLAEISVGNLAEKNGGSEDVKSFGKMLIEDHTASNTKATSLAQANGITPPTEPNAEEKKMHDELAKLSGREFDREFAKAMVKGHEDAIAKFEAASKGDDDVAKFAQETLPTLQEHLKTAQSLASSQSTQNEAKPPEQMAPEATPPSAPPAAASSTKDTAELATKLPADAISISTYYNEDVYDTQDNKIGDVNDILLDKDGRLSTAIIGVGGFLGVGEKDVAVPFKALKVAEKAGDRYLVINATKEALEKAPGYVYDQGKGVWLPATKER